MDCYSNCLGGHYGNEDLNIEFKEFCLKISLDLFLEKEEAEEILEKHIWNEKLQKPIDYTIELYLNKILKKYISSFNNSGISGEFIIGVNDDGEISGVPIMGSIDKERIKEIIEESLENIIFVKNECANILGMSEYNNMLTDDFKQRNIDQRKKLLENIDIELIKLDINENLLENEFNDYYQEYKKGFMENNDRLLLFKQEKFKWLINLEKYSTKLSILINQKETRKELIDYILNKTDSKNSESKNFNTDPVKIGAIINKLKTDQYISIPLFDELQIRKIDHNDEMFWLVQFKDEMTHNVCKERPKKPSLKRYYTPLQIISKLSSVKSIFSKIKDVNYYLIKIKINYFDTDYIYYKDETRWIKKIRKVHCDGSPYSE